MAIALRGTPTVVAYGSRTNITVTAPTGTTTGDYVVVTIAVGGPSAVTPTTPSGWTLIRDVVYYATGDWYVHLLSYGRFTDGAASWTFPHPSSNSQAVTTAWSGVDPTTPVDTNGMVVAQNEYSTSNDTSVTVSLTTVTAGALGVIARGSWDGIAITPPTGWTERSDTPILWVGDRLLATAGSTGSIVVPGGNSSYQNPIGALTFALRPSSGAESVTRTAAGGVSVGGSAVRTVRVVSVPAGGVTLSGSASGSAQVTGTAAGGVVLSGTAESVTRVAVTASGGVALSGDAPVVARVLTTAAGALTLDGAASGVAQVVSAATGGVVLLGAADVAGGAVARDAMGTLTLTGTTDTVTRVVRDAAGSIVIGGVGVAEGTEILTATGGITLSGAAVAVTRLTRTATGGVILAGMGRVGAESPFPDVRTLTGTTPARELAATTYQTTLTATVPERTLTGAVDPRTLTGSST